MKFSKNEHPGLARLFLCPSHSLFFFQDEMLARFVVNSHVKHHPNAVNNDENEDEEREQVLDAHFHHTCAVRLRAVPLSPLSLSSARRRQAGENLAA